MAPEKYLLKFKLNKQLKPSRNTVIYNYNLTIYFYNLSEQRRGTYIHHSIFSRLISIKSSNVIMQKGYPSTQLYI